MDSSPWHPWSEKRIDLFSPLFLCLSRACLGKMIVLSIKMVLKRCVFRTSYSQILKSPCCAVRMSKGQRCCEKTDSVFEFSLCLSRVCLGKVMHFIYKWLKKSLSVRAFPCACPEPVMANIRFRSLGLVCNGARKTKTTVAAN
jgi:hypothetical protein